MGNEIKDVKRVNVPLEANFLTSTIRGQWAYCADTKRVLGHNLLAETIDFGVSDDSLQMLKERAETIAGAKTWDAVALFNENADFVKKAVFASEGQVFYDNVDTFKIESQLKKVRVYGYDGLTLETAESNSVVDIHANTLTSGLIKIRAAGADVVEVDENALYMKGVKKIHLGTEGRLYEDANGHLQILTSDEGLVQVHGYDGLDLSGGGVINIWSNGLTPLINFKTSGTIPATIDADKLALASGIDIKIGNTKTGTGDVAVDGYITILDSAGATVKLATVA